MNIFPINSTSTLLRESVDPAIKYLLDVQKVSGSGAFVESIILNSGILFHCPQPNPSGSGFSRSKSGALALGMVDKDPHGDLIYMEGISFSKSGIRMSAWVHDQNSYTCFDVSNSNPIDSLSTTFLGVCVSKEFAWNAININGAPFVLKDSQSVSFMLDPENARIWEDMRAPELKSSYTDISSIIKTLEGLKSPMVSDDFYDYSAGSSNLQFR